MSLLHFSKDYSYSQVNHNLSCHGIIQPWLCMNQYLTAGTDDITLTYVAPSRTI